MPTLLAGIFPTAILSVAPWSLEKSSTICESILFLQSLGEDSCWKQERHWGQEAGIPCRDQHWVIHVKQKVCPQGIVTGSRKRSKQTGQYKYSEQRSGTFAISGYLGLQTLSPPGRCETIAGYVLCCTSPSYTASICGEIVRNLVMHIIISQGMELS